MAIIRKNNAQMAWAWQSGKGTPAGSSANRIWLAGGDLLHVVPVQEPFNETNSYDMVMDEYVSEAHGEGSPQHYAMPDMLGSLLYGILGAQAISGAGDPYTHTLTWALALPWATVWPDFGGGSLDEKHQDAKLTHLKLHGESGKPLEVTPTWISATPSYASSQETTAAIEKTNRFLYYDGQAALKLEGTALPMAKSFDLDIDRGVTPVQGDSLGPVDLIEGAFTATLQLVVTASDFALYKQLAFGSKTPSAADPVTSVVQTMAGSPAGIDFKFTRVAATRTAEILMPNVILRPFADQPSTDEGGLERTLTFEARMPAAGTTPVTGVVLNSKATTY